MSSPHPDALDTSRSPGDWRIVSFVRRGGRLTPAQREAWKRLGPRVLTDVPRDTRSTSVSPGFRLDPAALFAREADLVVEIGGGQGEALVTAAARQPERDFLGCEVYGPGLARTMMDLERAGDGEPLPNVRLVQADAVDLLHALEPASLAEVWTFFPDPWPKKRHHKRRLVAPAFAALVAGRLRPGGLWRLATDWADYADQMRAVLDACAGLVNLHDGDAPRFDRPMTRFESRAADEGRAVVDLAYARES